MTSPLPNAGGIRANRREWLAVLAVAFGIFLLMTSVLLPVGLLTAIGSALDVSAGIAGLMVTVTSVVAAPSAILITAWADRLDQRLLLGALLSVVAAANIAAAVASSFAVLLVARLLIGVSVGGYMAVACSLPPRLVPGQSVGKATAVIFSGVSAASVIGVPVSTAIGDLLDWRIAFWATSALTVIATALLLSVMPPLAPRRTITVAGVIALIRQNEQVRAGVVVTSLLITGHWVAFTFVRPILQGISHFDGTSIGVALLWYGLWGLVGNFAAGVLVARDVRRLLVVVAVVLATSLVLFALGGSGTVAGTLLLSTWGAAYGAAPVILQMWMITAAPAATPTASSLLIAAFNLSIAVGALAGGATVDATGVAGVLWLGSGTALLAALTVTGARRPASAESR